MPLFARYFSYYKVSLEGFALDGSEMPGVVSSRTVCGTIQPLSANEILAMAEGNRQNGTVKIYSSDRLDYRRQESDAQGFVKDANGQVYEIVAESANLNSLISHYKYMAALVPVDQIPAGVV